MRRGEGAFTVRARDATKRGDVALTATTETTDDVSENAHDDGEREPEHHELYDVILRLIADEGQRRDLHS